jgi:hypothetical protein
MPRLANNNANDCAVEATTYAVECDVVQQTEVDSIDNNVELINRDKIQSEFFDIERSLKAHNERVAVAETLAAEQRSCLSLQKYWKLAKQNKGYFCVENGLLNHREII